MVKGENSMLKPIVKQRIEETFSKIEKDPSLMSIPYENLKRFREEKYLNEKYLNHWEKILKLPIAEIKELMLSENEEGEILRSTSIFIRIP